MDLFTNVMQYQRFFLYSYEQKNTHNFYKEMYAWGASVVPNLIPRVSHLRLVYDSL